MGDRTIEQLELECRRQQALTRALLEALVIGVCVVDDSGRILTVNPVGNRILGWSESLIRGQSCHEILGCSIQPNDESSSYCPITSVLHGQTMAWTPRTRLRCRNEEWKWVELTATGLKEYGLTGALLTFRDLTSEIQFAEDYRRLASIPEGSPFPIVEVDASANLQYANAAMATLMDQAGLRPEGFSAAFPFNFAKLIRRCLTRDAIQRDVEVDVGKKQYAWLFAPHQDLGLVRGYGIDVTDRKQAADELAAFADTLEVKNRELDQTLIKAEAATRTKAAFLATMSHEIRTPLNGIIGMTQIMVDSELSQDQRECVEVVRSSAEALLTIINDILDFSKIEAGKLKLEYIPFNLSILVEEVLDLFAERAQRKGLDLAGIIRSDVPISLCGDPNRLRQILTNFVGNAIKFTDLGEVTIEVDKLEEVGCEEIREGREEIENSTLFCASSSINTHYVMLRFSVRDTGIGIAPEVQTRLFQAFSQADASTTRKYGGTGLGLAISRQLTELMEGSIGIESAPGVGTTFWCAIPFEQQVAEQVNSHASGDDLSEYRVLILGCPPATRSMLEECLRASRANWASTSECSQAQEWLQEAACEGRPYHVVMLDTLLTEPTRIGFAQWVNANPLLSHLRVLLLTPFGWRGDIEMLKWNGITATMTKPIRRAQLVSHVTNTGQSTQEDHPARTRKEGPNISVYDRYVRTQQPSGEISQGPVVLVAEDNPVNQRVAVRTLEKLGCRPIVVSDGQQAVDAVAKEPIELVLMDWQMPGVDGLQATSAIRNVEWNMIKEECSEQDRESSGALYSVPTNPHSQVRRIPIIGMTANAMEGDRERCLEAGMDDYVTKPIRTNIVGAILRRWLPAAAVIRMGNQGMSPQSPMPTNSLVSQSSDDHGILDAPAILTLPHDGKTNYDVHAALEAMGGDWELLKSLIALFLESCPKMINQICHAYESQNLDLLKKTVHQLKGALSTLHAVSAATAAGRLERLIGFEGWDVLKAAYIEFDQYMKMLIQDLETVIEQHKDSANGLPQSG